jgi:hypothetical protein
MASSSLFSAARDVLELFLKGLIPPMVSGALIIAGLLIGSVYAWIPIVITIAVFALVFIHRVNGEVKKDVEAMKKGFVIRPISVILEEYRKLLPTTSREDRKSTQP